MAAEPSTLGKRARLPTNDPQFIAAYNKFRNEAEQYFDDEAALGRNPNTLRAASLSLLADSPDLARDCLTVAAAASYVPTTSEPDNAADAWTKQFLPHAPSTLTLRTFQTTGRGLAATTNLEAGDVALRLPISCILTASVLPKHELLEGIDPDLRLALALLREPIREPNGPWAQYYSLLPKPPPSALHWLPRQLAKMGLVQQQVEQLEEGLKEAFDKIFPALSDEKPDDFPKDRFRLELVTWAYAIVETRALCINLLTLEGPKTTCLIPYADMLNHSPTAALAWPKVEVGTGPGSGAAASSSAKAQQGTPHIAFRTLRKVSAGEEVHLYYGRLAALQTLQFYGFVDERTLAHEVVQLDLDLPDEEVAIDASALQAAGGEGEDENERLQALAQQAAGEQREMRITLLEKRGLNDLRHYLRDHGPLPSKLVRTLRVLCMSAEELTAASSVEEEPVTESAELEQKVRDTLRSVLANLAETLLPDSSSAAMEEKDAGGAPANGMAVADVAGIDNGLRLYAAFQQRVISHSLAQVASMGPQLLL